jgi:sigma-B regulation protein RsbU (phosphoserine phosphatase)
VAADRQLKSLGTFMETELKILLLEDNHSDAELLVRTLDKAGVRHTVRLVESRGHFVSELDSFTPDLIISDYSLPAFSSLEALGIAREKYGDIPFILVTGSVSEQFAVECMKAGVDDYILKSSLVRLPSSIKNIVSKISVKREKESIESLHEELKVAYRAIEENNKNITDSLNYAKLIQDAMLPERSVLTKYFPDSLIIYRPKDIVSGDFYWFAERDNKLLVAVADCTGHGVPGSLMAMIGIGLLNEIVNVKKIMQPGEILDNLNSGLRKTMKQDRGGSHRFDGMDVSLCSIDKYSKVIEFAGANRHLIYFRNRKLELIRGNKYGIGGLLSTAKTLFTNHVISYGERDIIYMCTDGYADQFGGSRGKRMMTRNLFKILEKSLSFGIEQQQQLLIHWLDTWQGDYEQTDDILLMGIQL